MLEGRVDNPSAELGQALSVSSMPASHTSPADKICRWVAASKCAAAAPAKFRRAELPLGTEEDFLRDCLMLDQHFRSLDLSAFPSRPCGMVGMQRISNVSPPLTKSTTNTHCLLYGSLQPHHRTCEVPLPMPVNCSLP